MKIFRESESIKECITQMKIKKINEDSCKKIELF